MTDQITLDFGADLERDRERLAALAGEMGLARGAFGLTVGELRVAAENKGILTGQESASRMKALNLGKVLRAGGLFKTERFRRSIVKRSHSNAHVVWTIQEHAERTA